MNVPLQCAFCAFLFKQATSLSLCHQRQVLQVSPHEAWENTGVSAHLKLSPTLSEPARLVSWGEKLRKLLGSHRRVCCTAAVTAKLATSGGLTLETHGLPPADSCLCFKAAWGWWKAETCTEGRPVAAELVQVAELHTACGTHPQESFQLLAESSSGEGVWDTLALTS